MIELEATQQLVEMQRQRIIFLESLVGKLKEENFILKQQLKEMRGEVKVEFERYDEKKFRAIYRLVVREGKLYFKQHGSFKDLELHEYMTKKYPYLKLNPKTVARRLEIATRQGEFIRVAPATYACKIEISNLKEE